ncbi:MAG: LD-carboxypeptidase [Ignavibacteriaceae bacterium]|nr:LD-carboxypeptidase [Ignavibacteriaceae bacterium]
MKRSQFLASSLLLSLSPFVRSEAAGIYKKTIIPPRLKQGDRIALVSPGGFITADELKDSRTNIEALGFEVVDGKSVVGKYGYLGGSDKERADDINWAFGDKAINGIVCTRGGYGCGRILPMLDYELIEKNPKVLMGYSDITALFYGIYTKTGLTGFHGPVGISTFNDYSVNHLRNVVINPVPVYTLDNAPAEAANPDYELYTISGGTVRGKLIGGNLSLVVSVIGTEFNPDYTGAIIFLEEVREEPYRIDRMLTQLVQSGAVEKCNGIALGVFSKCNPKESESAITTSLTLKEVLFDRLGGLGKPVCYGLSFGHIANKFTLPFGTEAELDADSGILKLIEPAVR